MTTRPDLVRHVDPTKPAGLLRRAGAAFSATRFMLFLSRHISWKLDPLLLRLTRGRLATTIVFPTNVLETTGARTGMRRRNAVIYFHDAEAVTIVASHAGRPRNPGWYHNIVAHPRVIFGGVPMIGAVVDDKVERERLWALADNVYPAFAKFRRDAAKVGRRKPIVQLRRERRAPGGPH